jgi:hypothetical protein
MQGVASIGDYQTTWKGTDPQDAAICIRVSTGRAAESNAGKAVELVYGWYNYAGLADVDSHQIGKIRAELGPILAGQKEQADFDLVLIRPDTAWVWTNEEIWRLIGKEKTTIDKQTLDTLHLEFREIGKAGTQSGYKATWNLWYDPVHHIWVKGFHQDPGGPIVFSFEVTSISPP